jgi:superoxide dismutase
MQTNIISSLKHQNNMNQADFVIFAELNRERFDEILQSLKDQFNDVQSGRQGDDWIWIHLADDDKIEIDSFFSMQLEVKGKYKHLAVVTQILQQMDDEWIIQVFDSPKMDTTR